MFFRQLIYVVALAFLRVIQLIPFNIKKKGETGEEGFELVVALIIFFSSLLIKLH